MITDFNVFILHVYWHKIFLLNDNLSDTLDFSGIMYSVIGNNIKYHL